MRRPRRSISWGAFALASGALAIALAGPGAARAALPGPVRRAHASFEERCEACHAVASDGLAGWIARPVAGASLRRADSVLCLECHDLGPAPFAAHSAAGHGGAFECSTCHGEHHGPGIRDQERDDAGCRPCHAVRIDGLEEGHPGFGDWPHEEPTAIAFDHAAHGREHFAEKGEPFACASCHRLEPGGRRMASPSFETGCARCHAGAIQELESIYLFRPPRLDLDLLPAIGRWPRRAARLEAKDLPAFFLALLAGEPGLDLGEGPLDRLEPDAAAGLAWRTKALLADLVGGGDEALGRRLGGVDPRTEAFAALAGRHPADRPRARRQDWREALAVFQSVWFAGLPEELAAREAGTAVATVEGRERLDPDRDWTEVPGWSLRNDGVAFRPSGHADPTIRAWIDLLSADRRPGADLARRALLERSPGADCVECHRPGSDAGGTLRVAWLGARWTWPDRSGTRFDHAAHAGMPDLAGCDGCHELLEPTGESRGTGLAAIERSTCLECHGDEGVRLGCLSCHDYHGH